MAHFLNSSLNKGQINQVKADLLDGKTKMLYVAPETLTKQENLDFFKDLKISFFCSRRGALYIGVGTRFSPGISSTSGGAQEIPLCSLHGVDCHSHTARAQGYCLHAGVFTVK